MEEIRYSKDHMWARLDDDGRLTIGISDFAAQDWGEAVSVSIPEEGTELVKDEEFGTFESAEDNIQLFAPLSGEVVEINEEIVENPEIINEDPLQDGWLFRMIVPLMSDFSELLTEEEYEDHIHEEMDAVVEEVEEVAELDEEFEEGLDDDDLDDEDFDDED